MDLAIAGTLALLPLLPAGPTWLGLQWPWALEVVFLVFATFALLVVLTTRASAESAARPRQLQRLVAHGYLIWLVPVVAAMVIGLLERNPLDARLIRIEADGLLGRLAAPMDQAADPFYPLRVGLTVVEGGLMFFLLSAILRRTPDPGRRARTALAGCLAGMTIVSALAIVQYVTRANLHEYWVRIEPRSHAQPCDAGRSQRARVVPGTWDGPGGRRRLGCRKASAVAPLRCVSPSWRVPAS